MYRRLLLVLVFALTACSGERAADPVALGPSLELIAGDAVEDPTGGSDFLVIFDSTMVGQTRQRSIRFRNAGDREAGITASSVEGPFAIAQLPTLPPGSEGEIPVIFEPQEAGSVEGHFVLFDGRRAWSVRLLGSALAAPACVPRLASSLDLGTTEAGSAITGTLPLYNDGNLPCSLELGEPTNPAFTAAGPATIEPRASASVQITFAPRGTGPGTSTLPIRIGAREETVELRAAARASCLTLPERVEVTAQTCGVAEQSFELANACDQPVQIDGLALEGSRSWWIENGVVGPVAARGTAQFDLRYLPVLPGHDEALLGIVRAGRPAESVLLAGTTSLAAPQEDRYSIAGRPKTDRLVIVDDGPAMGPFRQRLVELLDAASFPPLLDVRDLHLGLTTTSLAASEACAGSGADGRLLPLDGSAPRVVSSEADGSLSSRLPDAFCSAVANQGFEAAWRALTTLSEAEDDVDHPEADDGNAGFLRDDAELALVFISAGDDTSAEPVSTWSERFSSLRDRVRVSAVVAPPGGCGGATEGARYQALASSTGGTVRSICDFFWGRDVVEFEPPQRESHFSLQGFPLDQDGDGSISGEKAEVEVRIDGVVFKPGAERGWPRWWYEAESNAVVFAEGSLPPQGSELVIAYTPACTFR